MINPTEPTMVRARVWLVCAAMHDPVSPVLVEPCRIGWQARRRTVDLVIQRPLKGAELLARMKGWVTADVGRVAEVLTRHGRLKLLDERELVVECEGEAELAALSAELGREFGAEVELERLR